MHTFYALGLALLVSICGLVFADVNGNYIITTLLSGYNQPYGIWGDSGGSYLYIGCKSSGVYRYNLASAQVDHVASGVTVDGGIWGNNQGSVYFCARSLKHVYRLDTSSMTYSIFAGSGTGGDGVAATSTSLSDPFSAFCDSNGNVYITDYGANKIRMVSVTTNLISTLVSGISKPISAVIDGINNVMYYDLGDQGLIYKVLNGGSGTQSIIYGQGSTTANGIASTSAAGTYAMGMFVDSNSNLYLTDQGSCLVRVIMASSSLIYTLAGSAGLCSESGDNGYGTQATLNTPHNVWGDSNGVLYVSTWQGGTIRKLTSISPTVLPTPGPTVTPSTGTPTLSPTALTSVSPTLLQTAPTAKPTTNFPTNPPSVQGWITKYEHSVNSCGDASIIATSVFRTNYCDALINKQGNPFSKRQSSFGSRMYKCNGDGQVTVHDYQDSECIIGDSTYATTYTGSHCYTEDSEHIGHQHYYSYQCFSSQSDALSTTKLQGSTLHLSGYIGDAGCLDANLYTAEFRIQGYCYSDADYNVTCSGNSCIYQLQSVFSEVYYDDHYVFFNQTSDCTGTSETASITTEQCFPAFESGYYTDDATTDTTYYQFTAEGTLNPSIKPSLNPSQTPTNSQYPNVNPSAEGKVSSSSGLSVGSIIGIVIGGAVVLVLLVVLIYRYSCNRRKKSQVVAIEPAASQIRFV